MLSKACFIFSAVFFLLLNPAFSQEVCNNGIDDDGDGLIDLNDAVDCACAPSDLPVSLIPNPSFEDTLCCPSSTTQINCADQWIVSNMFVDYYNLCNFGVPSSGSNNSPPQFPLPGNGEGYAGSSFSGSGNASSNLMSCLSAPLVAGNSYTISFFTAYSIGSVTNTVGVFGSPNCGDMPWVQAGCPVGLGSWQALGSQSVAYAASGAWQQVTITFTPTVTINALNIGPPCGIFPAGYYFFDEFVLNATPQFNAISEQGSVCREDIVLNLNAPNASNFQWYQNNIALPGETTTSLNAFNYTPGNYTATFTQDGICKFLNYTIDPPAYPTANVIVLADSVCLGESIILLGDSSLSTVSFGSWSYDFDDGTPISNDFSVFREFPSVGSFNVKFVVASDLGCKDSVFVPVNIFAVPVPQAEVVTAGITYQIIADDTLTICGNDSLYFSDLSTIIPPSTITNYQWDFGDLNTSNLENPVHKYANVGFYNVQLITQSDKGCEDTLSFVLELLNQPTSDFTFNANHCEYEDIDFTNTSSTAAPSSISHYTWHFGDLNQSTAINPQHFYNTAGTYNIQLITENTNGCSDSITQQITIHPKPVSNFQIANFCENETINFTDQSTVQASTIINWDWRFGDDSTAAIQNPTHNYTTPNIYTISLIIETDQGCKDTLDSLYTIAPAPMPSFTVEAVCENQTSSINNQSSISSGTMSYSWMYEDNGNSTLANPPSITYSDSGQYDITLSLTSDLGCTADLTKNLIIYPVPMAIINEDPIVGCSPLQVKLSRTQDNNIDNCLWDLGNGTVLDDCGTIKHNYQAGLYDVSLTVSSNFGCENVIVMTNFIDVTASPIADFTHTPNTVTVQNNEVTFTNKTRGATDYLWDFGGNIGTSTEANPIAVYPALAGYYSATLTAFSSNGLCEDQAIQNFRMFDELIFYVPNTFTPDGSSVNDIFLPIMTSGFNVYNYTLTIFNRYGEVVFLSHDAQVGWNGMYGGKPAQIGTYVWQIDYSTILKDENLTERGMVTLLR